MESLTQKSDLTPNQQESTQKSDSIFSLIREVIDKEILWSIYLYLPGCSRAVTPSWRYCSMVGHAAGATVPGPRSAIGAPLLGGLGVVSRLRLLLLLVLSCCTPMIGGQGVDEGT